MQEYRIVIKQSETVGDWNWMWKIQPTDMVYKGGYATRDDAEYAAQALLNILQREQK